MVPFQGHEIHLFVLAHCLRLVAGFDVALLEQDASLQHLDEIGLQKSWQTLIVVSVSVENQQLDHLACDL